MEQSQRLASRSLSGRHTVHSTNSSNSGPSSQTCASQSKRSWEISETLGLNWQRNRSHLFPRILLGSWNLSWWHALIFLEGGKKAGQLTKQGQYSFCCSSWVSQPFITISVLRSLAPQCHQLSTWPIISFISSDTRKAVWNPWLHWVLKYSRQVRSWYHGRDTGFRSLTPKF